MAGAQIKITIRDREVRAAFARLDGGLVAAALKNIGQQLVKSTRRRFEKGVDPEGHPWKALNPEYAKGKKGAGILRGQGMRGGLMGSITFRVEGNRVLVGTNKVYAAIHQLGGTIRPKTAKALAFRIGGKLVLAQKVTIPARPYLGISEGDRPEMLQVVRDHIARVWEGER